MPIHAPKTAQTPHANPTPTPAAMPKPSRFLNRLICFLMPFFLGECPDADTAQLEILETLASYGARSRAELLNAAQIIAYGLSALDALHEAKTAEVSTSMRLRLRGCANNLNRSVQQNEQRLAKRLACDAPSVTQPLAELINPEPIGDISDAQLEQQFQQIQAQLAAARLPLPTPPTAPPRTPAAIRANPEPRWSSAMMQAVADEVAAHAATQSPVPNHVPPTA